MIARYSTIIMVILAAWVGSSTIRIEVKNADAGYYLPRQDDDGKWRVSVERTSRDELRDLITSIGLLQYILAPLLIIFSIIFLRMESLGISHIMIYMSMIIGIIALGSALYRGYFTSLGY
jgi:hypothetical protein